MPPPAITSAADFYAAYLLQGLRQLGVPGLDESLPRDGEGRVPLSLIDDWLLRGQAVVGDDLGLRLGALVTPTALDVLGYASMACSVLGEAIELLIRFEPYRLGFVQTRLENDGRLARVVLEASPQACATVDLQVEAALTGWVSFGRWIAATQRRPIAIDFQHLRKAPLWRYTEVLGCEVRFGQPNNAVRLEPADLMIPLASPNQIVSSVMGAALDERVTQFDRGLRQLQRVEQGVEQLLGRGEPTLEVLAAHLDLDAGSLRRALQGADMRFTDLIERTRQRLARSYLQSSLPLSEIAQRLGYSEQSAFTRACRRWFGDTPSRLRSRA